jgi:geranylgeranyl diphosphate synthase type I
MASLHRVSRRDVMVGQFMDALGPHLPMPDDPEQLYEEALAVVRSKSAMYSVAAPLTIGAAAAGAGEAESNVMMKFGMPLGEAFQLRDDQLAITGDPNVTGKGGGGDLADGKRTVLIAMTLRRLPDEEAKPFLRALSRGGKPPVRERVEHLREIIIGSGALDDLEAAIQRRVDRALQALEQSDMRPSGKQIMRDVAHMLVDRQA